MSGVPYSIMFQMESFYFAKLKADLSEQDGILVINFSGTYTLDGFKAAIDLIRSECEKRQWTLAFADITTVQAIPTAMERYSLGEYISRILGFRIKFAVLTLPDIVNHLAENVAVNRGARIQLFFEKEEAMNWLHSASN
jgi:hypothetical protein